jgi:hypothetical protein
VPIMLFIKLKHKEEIVFAKHLLKIYHQSA